MSAKVKGLFKGFKHISNIFVYKEHEMEIGYPTDVRHVAHIGWDGHSGNAPSWMKEFKTASDFSSTNMGQSRETSWDSKANFDQPRGPSSRSLSDHPRPELPKAPKKTKRKKTRISSDSSSRSRSSRASYATAIEDADERNEYRMV